MKLTGKAKDDFERWLFYNRFGQSNDTFVFVNKRLDNKLLINLYVEWLDTVGIYINICSIYMGHEKRYSEGLFYSRLSFQDGSETVVVDSKGISRHSATEAAINKAMEIYNSK